MWRIATLAAARSSAGWTISGDRGRLACAARTRAASKAQRARHGASNIFGCGIAAASLSRISIIKRSAAHHRRRRAGARKQHLAALIAQQRSARLHWHHKENMKKRSLINKLLSKAKAK